MAERAHVTSVEALETFRTNLIVYISKARPTLDEVNADVLRIRLWLQNDQRMHWEGQVRRRTKELEAARQALFSVSIANLRETSAAETMAVRRAERALDEAQTKLRIVKKWDREFDSRMSPLAKQLEKLQTLFANDLPQAVAYLSQAVKTLDAYAHIAASSGPDNPTPASASEKSDAQAIPPSAPLLDHSKPEGTR